MAAPPRTPTPPTTTRGHAGTINYHGFFAARDAVTEWNGPAMYRTVDQMTRSDPVVRAALLMFAMPVAKAGWTVEPGGPDPEDLIAAEALRRALEHVDWPRVVLRVVMGAGKYGHDVEEETYEAVRWDLDVPMGDGTSDQVTRDLWVPRGYFQRLAPTIFRWAVNDLGELEAIIQRTMTGGEEVPIPASQLFVFTLDQEGDDYRGTSMLRPAFRAWYTKQKLEVIDAIAQERAGVGTPYGVLPDDADPESDGSQLLAALQAVRVNEVGALVVRNGTTLGSLDLSGKANTVESARYHATQILWSILGAWQGLGHEGEGARATAEAQDDPYYLLCTTIADGIAAAANRQIVARFTAYNFPTLARPPRLRVTDVTPTDVGALATAVATLTNANVLHADEGLERHMRAVFGLPEADPEEDTEEEDTGPVEPPEPTTTPDPAQEDGDPAAAEGDNAGAQAEDPAGAAPGDKPRRAAIPTHWTPAGAPVYRASTGEPMRPRWRTPTPLEQHVLMDAIEDAVRDQRAVLEDRCRDEARRIATALDNLAGNQDPDDDLALPAALTDALEAQVRDVLLDVAAYGRFTIRHELASQRGRRPRTLTERPPKDPRKLDAYLTRLARRSARAVTTRLLNRAQRLRDASLGGSPAEHARLREERLLQTADAALRAEASANVGLALSAGRRAEAQAAHDEGLWDRAVYSALLDANCCGPCRDLDGGEYQPGTEAYERDYPPLYACEGEARCRCMMILVAGTEVPAQR